MNDILDRHRSGFPGTPTKACPVVLRGSNQLEVLAFRHPLAGLQLVKGSIEQGETPREAALRELGEESGIHGASIVADLGVWVSGYKDQVWSFHLCQVNEPLPDEWVHHAADDGGRDFHFFWHRLADRPTGEWAAVYRAALSLLCAQASLFQR